MDDLNNTTSDLSSDEKGAPTETLEVESLHTRGLWEVDKASGWEYARLEVITIVGCRRIVIADCGREGNCVAQANARLIAAAPALLEACQGLLDLVTEFMPNNSIQVHQAIAAISKATGDTQQQNS